MNKIAFLSLKENVLKVSSQSISNQIDEMKKKVQFPSPS